MRPAVGFAAGMLGPSVNGGVVTRHWPGSQDASP